MTYQTCLQLWRNLRALRALNAYNFGVTLSVKIFWRALRALRAANFGVPYVPKFLACPTCLACRKFWCYLSAKIFSVPYLPYELKILAFFRGRIHI